MEEASAVLPCIENDRAALAAMMATRPIWLAADVPQSEIEHVVAAHREALQPAHRLLLILVPKEPAAGTPLAEKLEADQDWRVALRRAEQDPGPETEVYITDATEYGLWYRPAGAMACEGVARERLCSDIDKFSLYAAVRVEAHERKRLEQLCSSTPPVRWSSSSKRSFSAN
jgi:3-deoxy-D-manno-octulosonic-acid transferase